MDARALTDYLDDYLCIRDVPDYKGAVNGLQVAGKEVVRKVAVAVDACQATIEMAVAEAADLMIVHHGLFWGSTSPVTGTYYRRLSTLIKNDIGLYSCHLPLDAHPEVGNNHVLTRRLGVIPTGTFGEFEGVPIGVCAAAEMTLSAFVERVRDTLKVDPLVIAAGPGEVRRVGVLTGGGGSWIDRAVAEGLDTYLTGEGAHHTYFDAEENGINVIYAGHYATETVGVQALGDHLAQRFGLEVTFLDHPTGL
jgi:dinuclear metal center YbgI/SA1388 family protein